MIDLYTSEDDGGLPPQERLWSVRVTFKNGRTTTSHVPATSAPEAVGSLFSSLDTAEVEQTDIVKLTVEES